MIQATTHKPDTTPSGRHARANILISSYFEAQMGEIERFWLAAGNLPAFEFLTENLMRTALALLERTPRAGRRLMDAHAEASPEAIGEWQTRVLAAERAAGGELYEYVFGDAVPAEYCLLYAFDGTEVSLLSIDRVAA